MDTTSNMQNMETIQLMSDEHAMAMDKECIRIVDILIRHARKHIEMSIEYARKLNKWGKQSVSVPLHGTKFLHGMLQDGIINSDLYQRLVRLAEDPMMEYEIKIITDENIV
jgi:hypothetical protein